MSNSERKIVVIILSFVAVLIIFDLYTDSENVLSWHFITEASGGVVALSGIFYFLKGTFTLQKKLSASLDRNQVLGEEASLWKSEAIKFIHGLSNSIDTQLTKWELSNSEKEVALLLLKGLSLKEIAAIRNTSEKTARAQSVAIYSKSQLAGRSELAAFFLEDLLHPIADPDEG